MTLALDLLKKGEFDVVSECFELCSDFSFDDELDTWRVLVTAGLEPEFGEIVYNE